MRRQAFFTLGVVLYGCANASVGEDTVDVEAAAVAQPLLEGECSQTELDSLLATVNWASAAIEVAADTTPNSDPERWYTWFSTNLTDDQIYGGVKSNLSVIATKIWEYELRCEHHDGGTGGPGFAPCHNLNKRGYVRQGEPIIHFCPSFFDLPDFWRVNGLIHEAAHLVLGTRDFTPDGSADEAEALADRDVDLALRNASNFAHFVTNDRSIGMRDMD